MRNYKRKRIGEGKIYAAIDTQLGEARIGYTSNIYTTLANLDYRWEVIAEYECDDAGLLDKRIHQVLRSERSNKYQSSKSYRLDSYRVQKVIKLLGAKVKYDTDRDYDICSCSNCESPIEANYISPMSIHKLIETIEDMLCDECDYKPAIVDKRKLLPMKDSNKDTRTNKPIRHVWDAKIRDLVYYCKNCEARISKLGERKFCSVDCRREYSN